MSEKKRNQVTMERILKICAEAGQHDMNPSVCKNCSQPHHYVVCVEDLLMGLRPTEKWLKRFTSAMKKIALQKAKNGEEVWCKSCGKMREFDVGEGGPQCEACGNFLS